MSDISNANGSVQDKKPVVQGALDAFRNGTVADLSESTLGTMVTALTKSTRDRDYQNTVLGHEPGHAHRATQENNALVALSADLARRDAQRKANASAAATARNLAQPTWTPPPSATGKAWGKP